MIVGSMEDVGSSLAACALVCRAWRPVARANHFKSLRLSSQDNVPARLLLTDDTSSVVPFIRDLSIQEGEIGAHWVSELLPHMRLNELVNLESITLEDFPWIDYEPHTRSIILSLLSQVKELRLLSLYTRSSLDIFELLAAAPLLRRLTHNDEKNDWLWSREVPSHVVRGRYSAECIPRSLAYLETNESELLDAVRYLAPRPPITSLVVNAMGAYCVPKVVAFLRASSGTMRHLTVRFIRSEGAPPTSPSAAC